MYLLITLIKVLITLLTKSHDPLSGGLDDMNHWVPLQGFLRVAILSDLEGYYNNVGT